MLPNLSLGFRLKCLSKCNCSASQLSQAVCTNAAAAGAWKSACFLSVVVGCGAFAGISPRRATHFLSLRRKKVSIDAATPLSATLRCATGNLSCDGWAGNRSNSLRSDNRGCFARPPVATQAHTEGTQAPVLVALRATLRSRCNARRSRASSAAPHAVVRRRVAQGWADQGSRLSERSEFERDPAQTEQRSEPSRSDGDGAPAKARH